MLQYLGPHDLYGLCHKIRLCLFVQSIEYRIHHTEITQTQRTRGPHGHRRHTSGHHCRPRTQVQVAGALSVGAAGDTPEITSMLQTPLDQRWTSSVGALNRRARELHARHAFMIWQLPPTGWQPILPRSWGSMSQDVRVRLLICRRWGGRCSAASRLHKRQSEGSGHHNSAVNRSKATCRQLMPLGELNMMRHSCVMLLCLVSPWVSIKTSSTSWTC